MITSIKITTNLDVSVAIIDKIEDLAVTERRIDLEDYVKEQLKDAYNLGLNQGKIEALHQVRKELEQ